MSQDQARIISQKLVNILHELLSTGNWQTSLFLRTAHDRIQDLYEQAAILSDKLDNTSNNLKDDVNKIKNGYIPVYVSLYQADAHNLIKWENILKTIIEQSASRPIYSVKEHVETLIRSKQGSPREAYVAIYVLKTHIIPGYAGKKAEDKLGHQLLTLRDHSLLPENIIEFVHQDHLYSYREGKLIPKADKK